MPAQVELYRNVTSPAPIVFCDANFLIDLSLYPSAPTKPMLLEAKNFFDFLSKKNVRCVTSPMAVQEVIYVHMFELGIKTEMGNFRDASGVPYANIKRFKKEKPAEYATAYQKYRAKVDKILLFLRVAGIKVIYPLHNTISHSMLMAYRVCNYARIIINKYEIEPADAFHIAFSKCARISRIVTRDGGYKQVSEIAIYAPA